ncbi:MAG: class I tRNA ligase family protein, partial [Dehalococcoidia bacterium]|nr:class I tRNA ligase family protein [Dehalococcoidia bacterium]
VDALRYYLLREIRTTDDGNFTLERFQHLYTSELAGQLGNLLNRVVTMIARYEGGQIPSFAVRDPLDDALIRAASGLGAAVDEAVERFAVNEAMTAIWDVVSAANKYIDDCAPWTLAKQRSSDPIAAARLGTALATVAETLRLVGVSLRPFLPSTARGILGQLGLDPEPTGDWATLTTWGAPIAGARVQPGALLFPKIEASVEA